uniref:Putative chaperonin n=1 Tax=viral metagenome TaxID=1070528 RepID=A0A6M3XKU1_9ZZZZ
MAEINSIKIAREKLDSGFIPTNHVMVESDLTVEGKKTKGGIIYGFDENVEFDDESTSHMADVAQTSGRVYKVPDKLYYNKEDPHNSMPHDCDMEVQVNDIVWFPPIEACSATALECDGKYFKLIPYRDLWVAKRSEEIILLNGYCLLSHIYKKNESPLAISKQGDIDTTKGIIRFVGNSNREYIKPEYIDFLNLNAGDVVLLNPGTPIVYLERKKYLATFLGDELFFVVQRRKIAMILSKGN